MSDPKFGTTLLGRQCRPVKGRPIEWERGTICATWVDASNVLWIAVETTGGRIVHAWATAVEMIPEST